MINPKLDNETKRYFYERCKVLFFLGAPNFWYSDLDMPNFLKKIYFYLSKFMDAAVILLIILEWFAFWTQNNLNEKQTADLILFSFSHPVIFSFVLSLYYYLEDIKVVLYILTHKLKVFNDKEVEREMVKRANIFSYFYTALTSMALVFYGIDGIIQVAFADGTFVTVITVWPDVNEQGLLPDFVRIINYIVWWIFLFRITTVYAFVIPVTVCLSHQYKNLCSYFYHLNDIFKEELTQEEKEKKFLEGVVVGINLHANTLWIKDETVKIFSIVFSGQILVNITVLIQLMSQVISSEHTFGNALASLSTTSAMLISTGCIMWTAGDVTVEASKLATAMFSSGWQNCAGASERRVRSLLLIAMWQSQRPVIIKCLGIIRVSYESYVSIVRSSYSVFSVLY
ncbi:uncharacterized protein LOC126369765 [Pectinophora gossypiella]|uniref:uncharacterized protein LOC126369765 n=1 Tax=Pectinophora gossypiella TaxID=13191 RepID=UPI00214E30CC|nr:uncharacterized protein LOC126369765 [Pectinophora gossypiella]